MTKQEFDNKYVGKRVGVHCKTKELAEEFLKLADYFDYKWYGGGKYTTLSNWEVYEGGTCYKIQEGTYGDLEYFKDNLYTIVEFEYATIKNDVLYDILIGKMAELEEDIETLQGIIDSTREEIVSKNDSLILIEELLEKYDDAGNK